MVSAMDCHAPEFWGTKSTKPEEIAAAREEWIGRLDATIPKIIINNALRKLDMFMVEFFVKRPVILLIAENPTRWISFEKLANKIDARSRFHFWQKMFENRDLIPKNQLISLWLNCYNDARSFLDTRNVNHQEVMIPCGSQEGMMPFSPKTFTTYLKDEEKIIISKSDLTDPMLIDNPSVCHRYCQVEKPGWMMLRYIDGRRSISSSLNEPIYTALKNDSVPQFAMHLVMNQKQITFSLLSEILGNYKAFHVFRYLLENQMINDDVIPLPELCCHLVAQFPDNMSVPLLKVLEEVHPGLLKSVHDHFGRNLLWYAVHNLKTGWFHPKCNLTPFLLGCGCDPDNANTIGLTWRYLTDHLTLQDKRNLMRHRYLDDVSRNTIKAKLRLKQPISSLEDDHATL